MVRWGERAVVTMYVLHPWVKSREVWDPGVHTPAQRRNERIKLSVWHMEEGGAQGIHPAPLIHWESRRLGNFACRQVVNDLGPFSSLLAQEGNSGSLLSLRGIEESGRGQAWVYPGVRLRDWTHRQEEDPLWRGGNQELRPYPASQPPMLSGQCL